jgi:hypothetical protein
MFLSLLCGWYRTKELNVCCPIRENQNEKNKKQLSQLTQRYKVVRPDLVEGEKLTERKRVGIVLFDNVEILDFCGPFEVFSRNPPERRETA